MASRSGENAHRRIDAHAAEVLNVMEQRRANIEEAVEAIKEPSVAGNRRGHVFDPEISFHARHDQVAELSGEREEKAECEKVNGAVKRASREDEMRECRKERARQHESAERPA